MARVTYACRPSCIYVEAVGRAHPRRPPPHWQTPSRTQCGQVGAIVARCACLGRHFSVAAASPSAPWPTRPLARLLETHTRTTHTHTHTHTHSLTHSLTRSHTQPLTHTLTLTLTPRGLWQVQPQRILHAAPPGRGEPPGPATPSVPASPAPPLPAAPAPLPVLMLMVTSAMCSAWVTPAMWSVVGDTCYVVFSG